MREIEGFILAGGASSRMGSDKAALRLGEETFVARVASALSGVAGRVSLVSSRHEPGSFGLPLVRDFFDGAGALGGLHAALLCAQSPWAAVVSCDLPFVTAELLRRLASLAGGFDAVAPLQKDGRLQPLCALYARRPCLEACEGLLGGGEFRPRALLGRVKARLVGFDEISDLAGSELFFRNVNTPDDYAEALRAHEATRGSDARSHEGRRALAPDS